MDAWGTRSSVLLFDKTKGSRQWQVVLTPQWQMPKGKRRKLWRKAEGGDATCSDVLFHSTAQPWLIVDAFM